MKRKIAAAVVLTGLVAFTLFQGMKELGGPKYVPAADTLSYRIDSIHLVSDDSLLFLDISYPVITENSEELCSLINGSIEPILYTLLFPDYRQDVILTDQIYSRFNELLNERRTTLGSAPWHLREEVELVFNGKGVISTAFSTDQYTGGAHGNRSLIYLTSEYQRGLKEVTLGTLFADEDRDALNEIGERFFRKARGLSDTANLTREGFWFEEGNFTLTDNFAIVPEGLMFHYNSYTIAPYSMGETELFLPLETFVSLLDRGKERYWF